MNDDCLKLTTYFGERDRTDDGLLADALLDRYGAAGIETSVLLRGIEGFGFEHQLHSDLLLSLSPMTFPHEMARAMLAEQIYRALATLRGHPYPR